MEHSSLVFPQRMLRPVLFVLGLVLLTACDGFIEQVSVEADGSVEYRSEATVVCTDSLQRELWGGDGCEQIDAIVRGADATGLPFDFELDQNRVGLVADGELDRRRIDATWSGGLAELETVLVSGGSMRALDDVRTEAVFTPSGSVADRITDSEFAASYASADWPPGEFRVVAPEIVVEHNGDDIQGRTVVWFLDDDRPDEFRVVWGAEERGLRIWWLVLAGLVLAGVLGMMAVLEGSKRGGSSKT